MSDMKIGYRGEVSIKLITRQGNVVSVQKHNSGTDRLFYGLCLSLASLNASAYMPKYIMLVKYNSVSGEYTMIQRSLSGVTPTAYSAVGVVIPNTKFIGLISHYQVTSLAVGANEEIRLALLDGSATISNATQHILAEVTPDMSQIDLSVGTVLSIEWSMSFENVQS